jgi:serine/threonine-protein kinase
LWFPCRRLLQAAGELMISSLGKYELRTVLARSAMSTVYEGWDAGIARKVAIKTISLPDPSDAEARDKLSRFKREARAAGRLSHPNIVGVFDYGETENVAFIVMEFVDGLSLRTLLEQERFLPLPHVLNIMRDVLEGLQYSHAQRVVHRDIKPANIMLTNSGRAKIADFGIARIESSNITQTGVVIGTPAYMSPEQLLGEPVDNRTDIYSTGVVLYELLAGERPFEGSLATIMHKALHTVPPKPSDVSVRAPTTLDAVVARAMAKKAEDRFATAAEFSDTLFRAYEATVSVARPQRTPPAPVRAPARATGSRPSRSSAPTERGYDLRKIAAVLMLVSAGLAGGLAYVFHRTQERPVAAQSNTDKQTTAQDEKKKKQDTPLPAPMNASVPAPDTTSGTPSTPSQPSTPPPPAPLPQPATTATTAPALPTTPAPPVTPLPEGTINAHPVATVSPEPKPPIFDAPSPNHVLIEPGRPSGPINIPPTKPAPDIAGPPVGPLVTPPPIEAPPRVQPPIVKQGPIPQAPKPLKPKLRSPPPSDLAAQPLPATASTNNTPNDASRSDVSASNKSTASPSAVSEVASPPAPPKPAPAELFGRYIIGPDGQRKYVPVESTGTEGTKPDP